MELDHEAIYKAYAGTVVSIDDSAGAFDEKGRSVELEQSKIDEARTALNAEALANKYKTDRTTDGEQTYPSIGDQLDALWHCIDADADLKVKFAGWYDYLKVVKDSNPKPS
jgi:hypothetical protein